MIITRTPFRISFFGGGTDYPSWYRKNEGMVISCAINKYCYITARDLPPFFKYKYRIRYYKSEAVKEISKIKHPSVRACLKKYEFERRPIEIVHNADLPAQSGLGSSSAFTVSLCHALSGLQSKMLTKKQLALRAIDIEQNILNESVGSQDQTITAFGGLNTIIFQKNNNIQVEKIIMPKDQYDEFQDSMLLIFTDMQRNANKISADQIKRIEKNISNNFLEKMMDVTQRVRKEIFLNSKFDIKNFGEALNIQWNLKKKLSKRISNKRIDDLYNFSMKNGAIGGKLLGAGNGGFFLLVVNKKNRKQLISKLKKYLIVPFRIDDTGSQIIYYK